MISNNNPQPQENQISFNISSNFYSAIFDHQETLSRADILIYYAIGDLGDLTHCDAYQDEIADRANISVRHCQRSIVKLVEAGLITVDKSRRQHHIYHYVYPKPGALDGSSQVGTTHESSQNLFKQQITKKKKSKKKKGFRSRPEAEQLALISDQNLQNLQYFNILIHVPPPDDDRTAAEVLAFDEDAQAIAENLARWRQKDEAGELDLIYRDRLMRPALIWMKIRELQPPPLKQPKLPDPDPDPELVKAVEAAEIAQESSQEAIIEPEKPVFPETIADRDQVLPDDQARPLTPEALSDPPSIDSDPVADLWVETLEDLRLSTTKATFESRLAQTRLKAMDDGFVISVPDPFTREWLDKRLRSLVVQKLAKRLGETAVEVEFVVAERVVA